jgi:sugar lactone lactonase YvrE
MIMVIVSKANRGLSRTTSPLMFTAIFYSPAPAIHGPNRRDTDVVGTLPGDAGVSSTACFFPNGIAFNNAEIMVVAETYRQRVCVGNWDSEAWEWREPRILAEVGGPTGLDRMAVGADDLIYMAVFGTGTVKAVDRRGVTQSIYRLPGKRPTNLAFNPAGRLGLVVTEAEAEQCLSLPDLAPGAVLFNGATE